MNTFTFTVSTPQESAQYTVQSVFLRGAEGDFAVLAGHIPFITSVQPGKCRVLTQDGEKSAYTDGGLLTVGKEETIFLTGDFTWE